MKIPTWVYWEMEDQIAALFGNCMGMKDLKKIYGHIIVSSLSQSNFLATKLINVCDANRETDYATSIFKQVTQPNTFLYNALIRAYAHECNYAKVVALYKQILSHQSIGNRISADRFTYPFALKACGGLLLLNLGQQIHAHVCKCGQDTISVIENSLLEMYSNCDHLTDAHILFDGMKEKDVVSWNILISAHAKLGQMRRARAIFDSMPDKSVISWTVLISGYTTIGCHSDALEVFNEMQLEGLKPDDITIVSVLPACAHLGALELGKWIHVYVDKNGLLQKTFVCNALIEMYAKCGSITQAHQLFTEMPERDVITWSTMIGALANHGRAQEAIALFVEMEREGRVKPNSITFLGLLTACAHAGLLAEGMQYFNSMILFYNLTPGVEHYGCMVDLLGRACRLDQAVELINSMPMSSDAAIWGSLLSACRTHGNVETAIIAMEHLIELEPADTGNYVLLANIYAAAGKWDNVSTIRKSLRSKHMKKTPGCSLIEVNNEVHEFAARDDSKRQFGDISRMLELLAVQLSRTDTDHIE